MKKTFFASAILTTMLLTSCFTTGTVPVTTTAVTFPVPTSAAMSVSKVRTHARFLTDRMAYELDLSPRQYEDCYEVNYDFVYYASTVMNDVARGYYDAINTYYRYLDYRNDDLRYILTSGQYVRFMSKDYFYRPIYTTGGDWAFRVYTIYSNRSFYYYDAPTVFKTYSGGHSRRYNNNGFYNSRYDSRDRYTGNVRITGSQNFNDHRRNDFGANLRDRNQKPDYNNYGNKNSNNRTTDPRYRDNSGNTHSPLINNRTGNGNNGNRSGNQPQTGNSQRNDNQRGNQPQTGTQTGTRSGNATPTTNSRSTETRGNRTTTTRQ